MRSEGENPFDEINFDENDDGTRKNFLNKDFKK